MYDLTYWLALNYLPEVGPVLGRRLLSAFGSPENIFQTPISDIRKIQDVGESRACNIAGFNQWDRIKKEIDKINKNNIKVLTFRDKEYPDGLKRISDAPLVLYTKGGIKDDDKFAIAMVGSRLASEYGTAVAERMGHDFASMGLTVVSGMARGIDTSAHRGALKAKGRTIAVLGSGIDVVYPPENKGLVSAIASSGVVVSEFPLGTRPNKENFPRRNRIISALSLGVVVVEATIDSGSLITVGYALEQGKEIFAVPGNITSKKSKGTNKLIKDGAKLVESAEEVIAELRLQIKGSLKEQKVRAEEKLVMMSEEEKVLYNYLDSEPKHIDVITRESSLPSSRALSILLGLELKGIIRQADGKRFSQN